MEDYLHDIPPLHSQGQLLRATNAMLQEKVQRLEAENEELKKDAARLDAIERNARCDPKMDGNHVWWPTTWKHQLTGPTLRAAIDAAMTKEPRAATPQDKAAGAGAWGIDHSAGRPILVYENCSVIEDEQARYVLSLIAADQSKATKEQNT